MRGYFEIGVFHPKTEHNIGTLWRSAYQLGAAGIFTIEHRYKKQSSDTLHTILHIPLRQYESFDDFLMARPHGAMLVGVEMGGCDLAGYSHPQQAIYLLGAEDHGLPPDVLAKCNSVVSIESIRTQSFNVAVAGAIVMYHRMIERLK